MLGLHSHKPYPTQTATRKRTHLKPSQVAVLQESFVTNTLPDATIRSQLALELGVTERTVQIWFQNRRAKARKLEAMSNSTPGGMSCLVPNVRTGWIEMPQHSIYQQQQNSHHHQQQPQNQQQHHHHQQQQQQLQQQQQQLQQHDQNNFRALMTPEYYEQPTQAIKRRPRSSSKPEKVSLDLLPPTAPQRAMSEGIAKDDLSQGELSNAQLVYFAVNTIRIGSWARFASMLNKDEWDLVCYSDPVQKQLIWQVQDDGHLFRIEVHFENIRQIRLGQVQTDMGQLEIQVEPNTTPISFSMRRADVDPDWVQCGDFTENRQASHQGIHALQGTHDSLRQSLLELIAQSPDLANKLILIPDKTPSLSRDDMASSPSATPEPFGQYYMNHWMDSAKPANPLFPPSYDWSYMLDQQTMHHFM